MDPTYQYLLNCSVHPACVLGVGPPGGGGGCSSGGGGGASVGGGGGASPVGCGGAPAPAAPYAYRV
jgi:hypothetical protein